MWIGLKINMAWPMIRILMCRYSFPIQYGTYSKNISLATSTCVSMGQIVCMKILFIIDTFFSISVNKQNIPSSLALFTIISYNIPTTTSNKLNRFINHQMLQHLDSFTLNWPHFKYCENLTTNMAEIEISCEMIMKIPHLFVSRWLYPVSPKGFWELIITKSQNNI